MNDMKTKPWNNDNELFTNIHETFKIPTLLLYFPYPFCPLPLLNPLLLATLHPSAIQHFLQNINLVFNSRCIIHRMCTGWMNWKPYKEIFLPYLLIWVIRGPLHLLLLLSHLHPLISTINFTELIPKLQDFKWKHQVRVCNLYLITVYCNAFWTP